MTLTIQRRLGLILVLATLITALLSLGLVQVVKGAHFHYLNSLHLKYVIELTQQVAPPVQVLPASADLRRWVGDIRTQPVACLRAINALDRLFMRAIGTADAIALCEQDIAQADRLLARIDDHDQGRLGDAALLAELRGALGHFRDNSERFVQPISTTIDFIVSGTLGLFVALATAMLLGAAALARSIAASLRRQARTEASLRESEERWKFALEGAGDAVWDWNIPSGEVVFSRRYAELLGHAESEIARQLSAWQERVHPDDLAQVMAQLDAYFDGSAASFVSEYRMRRKEGDWIWILARGMVVRRGADGRPLRMIGTHADITERKQLEHELRLAQKLQAMGTLAGGIAHDFNNIVGVILGNAELARQDVGSGHPALLSLEQIQKAGRRARSLVKQILFFSRGQVQEFQTLALATAVPECIKLLRSTIPAGVALEFRADTAPLHIQADSAQFNQVLMNLCINAWHAIGERGGRIDIRAEEVVLDAAAVAALPGLQPGRHARLSVSDDGCGMDEATRARIFEPFFTTKPVDRGTGLGLAVVHGIVQAHHGAISVRSTPGAGSTFELYFPLVDTPEHIAPPALQAVARGAGQRILYLDDDETMSSLASRMLERSGYRVSAYTDARAALRALHDDAQAFDLVVTDFNMPQVSGVEVARQLRRLRPELPVILISGYVSDEMQQAALQAGVWQIIYKSNTMEALCSTVERVLREHAAAGPSPA